MAGWRKEIGGWRLKSIDGEGGRWRKEEERGRKEGGKRNDYIPSAGIGRWRDRVDVVVVVVVVDVVVVDAAVVECRSIEFDSN